jgi:hypothetical protein
MSKFGVQNVRFNSITKTNSQHLRNIWRWENQIHFKEDDTMRYVRNGAITQLSFHYYISTSVYQRACFVIFLNLYDTKRRIFVHSN